MRAIDLAVSAGRKRQSPRTGFIHLFASDDSTDTIPLYENFCFALALFRQKTAEAVLEGKNLVERLLAFQAADGNFPVYLHDFPKCWDVHLGAKIAPVLRHVLQDFGAVLGAEYKDKLAAALAKIPRKEHAAAAPKSAEEWFHWIVADQIQHQNGSYPIPWNAEIQVFTGGGVAQERGEPQPQPIEYILAEKTGFSKRLLRDHPNQIRSALLFPFSSSQEKTTPVQEMPYGLLWKGETVHSLYCPKTEFILQGEADVGKNDLFEAVVYCDISPEVSIFINGQKGMVFHFGDIISIRTPVLQIDLRFELVEGEGDFCGHISRANRPGGLGKGFEAFDWQIGLRTLRRQGACKILVHSEL